MILDHDDFFFGSPWPILLKTKNKVVRSRLQQTGGLESVPWCNIHTLHTFLLQRLRPSQVEIIVRGTSLAMRWAQLVQLTAPSAAEKRKGQAAEREKTSICPRM